MKILLLTLFTMLFATAVMAQRTTLGQSKDQFRATIKPNGGITLLKGQTTDTLTMPGGLQIVMYYRRDTCYQSISLMPIIYKNLMINKMTEDGYQKINDTTWKDRTKTVRVVVTDNSDKKYFTVVDTWWDISKK